jgi:hypothetical protein
VEIDSQYLFDTETQGVLQFAPSMLPLGPSGSDAWVYILTVVLPDGSAGFTFAILPVDPLDIPPLAHYYVWRRAVKPAEGALFTGPSGSKWVYPNDGTGLYRCYAAGGSFALNDTATRDVIDGFTGTNPPVPDPSWDWEPVLDDTVTVGDYLLWSYGVPGVVDSIGDPDAYGETNYYNGVDQLGVLNVDDTLNHTAVWDRRVFLMTAKPADGASFLATNDGSRWLYNDDTGYYECWSGGSTYKVGAIFLSADINGGLIPE